MPGLPHAEVHGKQEIDDRLVPEKPIGLCRNRGRDLWSLVFGL